MAVTPSKQWIHFFRSERWPPTSNILGRDAAWRRAAGPGPTALILLPASVSPAARSRSGTGVGRAQCLCPMDFAGATDLPQHPHPRDRGVSGLISQPEQILAMIWAGSGRLPQGMSARCSRRTTLSASEPQPWRRAMRHRHPRAGTGVPASPRTRGGPQQIFLPAAPLPSDEIPRDARDASLLPWKPQP